MIKLVAFDLDGVILLENRWFSKKFSEKYSIPFEEVLKFFNKEFQDCIKGKADLIEELDKYYKIWGINPSFNEIKQLWYEDENTVNERLLNYVELLKSNKIRVFLWSVNDKYKKAYFTNKLRLNEIFDKVLFSCDVGYKKSEDGFLKKLLSGIDFNAEEILFIDDDDKLIQKLLDLGYKTILYKNNKQLGSLLKDLGVSIELASWS